MRGKLSPRVVSMVSHLCRRFFKQSYDHLFLEISPHFSLEELQEKAHVVFVANHQSHVDYVALYYRLYQEFSCEILFAAGDNLNLPVIGPIFRRLGTFFIRRSFQGDITYRLTFEAYLSFLLNSGALISFFPEGGRSRTGKFRDFRYGFFQMLVEAHMKNESKKPLVFVPISIANEIIPEGTSMAHEVRGGAKQKERLSDLFNVMRLFNKKFGAIHLSIGEPLEFNSHAHMDAKTLTQEIAQKCSIGIARQMTITPAAILSLILLELPRQGHTLEQIISRAKQVVYYAVKMRLPLAQGLKTPKAESILKNVLNLFFLNRKVSKERNLLGEQIFKVRERKRLEMLYYKNSIHHHFFVAGLIAAGWPRVFSKKITDKKQFMQWLQDHIQGPLAGIPIPRPSEVLRQCTQVLACAAGRMINSIDDFFSFDANEYFRLSQFTAPFATVYTHLYEGFYLSCLTVKRFAGEEFSREEFYKKNKEIFYQSLKEPETLAYYESYSIETFNHVLQYLKQRSIIHLRSGKFHLSDEAQIDRLLIKLRGTMRDQIHFNHQFTED